MNITKATRLQPPFRVSETSNTGIRSCQSGFTLVELSVVLVIVAVLATVAIPSFNNVRTSVRNKACVADISNIQKVIEAYRAEKADLPDSLAVEGVNLDSLRDPWGRLYHYSKTPSLTFLSGDLLNTDYDLYSDGVDGASTANPSDAANEDNIVRASNGTYIGLRPE